MCSLSEHCHWSRDETGSSEVGAAREEENEGRKKEEHSSPTWGRGQADVGEGVLKDKARGENIAGFKGCR